MLKERREIVEGLRDQLHDTEMAVEAALVAIGRLVTAMPLARARANISPIAGQAVFDSMAAAMAGIVQVRGHMVDAHGHLEQTRGQFRLPVVGTGAGYEKPPAVPPAAQLEIVPNSVAA